MTRYAPKPTENMRQGMSKKFIGDKKESVMNHFYADYMNEALRHGHRMITPIFMLTHNSLTHRHLLPE